MRSLLLAATALLRCGSPTQQQTLLPGIADGSRRCQSTSQRDASTEASSSRLEGSAARMPSAVANENAGSVTSATMKTTGRSENRPSPIFTEAM